MKIPQRRQQSCGSSYLSARNYSKGPNKEDEGEKEEPGNRYFTFFFIKSSRTCLVQWAEKQRSCSEEQRSKTTQWCNPFGPPVSFWGPGLG